MSAVTEAEKAAFMEGKVLCLEALQCHIDNRGHGHILADARDDGETPKFSQLNVFKGHFERLGRQPELIDGYSAALAHAIDMDLDDMGLVQIENATYEQCVGGPMPDTASEAKAGFPPIPHDELEDRRNTLWTVASLIKAAEALLLPLDRDDFELDPYEVRRILEVARERVNEVARAFDPYI